MTAARSPMPLSVAFILSLWFIPMSQSQSLNIRTPTVESLLGCDVTLNNDNIGVLASRTTASTEGQLPRRLLTETLRLFVPGDRLFTRFLPTVQIISYITVCSSRADYNSGYSSLTALIRYTCAGPPCSRDPLTGEDGKTRTYVHLFSLFCVGDNTWNIQDDQVLRYLNFGGNYSRSHNNDIRAPTIAGDGECIVCTTDRTNLAKFPGSNYNPNTGCVACPRECSANSGSGYCLTALDNTDIDQRCCRYLSAPGSHCFTNCVGPRFSILASPVFPLCIPKILIELEGFKNQFCANDVIKFTCSTKLLSIKGDTLMWDINIAGENGTVTVEYTEDSRIGVASEYNTFYTVLTEYYDGSVASTVTISVNSRNDIFEADVKCSVGDLTPMTDTVRSTFLKEGPLSPTGFQIANQMQISVNVTNVTFEWDSSAGSTVEYYRLVTYPDSLSRDTDRIMGPPFTVSLLPYRIHNASLYAVNCIGDSLPTIVEVVTEGPDLLIVNEDTQEISVSSLEVTANSGDLAPNLLCVTKDVTVSLLWAKEGGFPFGITVSNGLALFGRAIKLDWEKKVHFTDTGNYTCTTTTEDGASRVMEVYLNVLKPPSITSVFPNFPTVKQVTSNIYTVPSGFEGVIFTCNAIGWPTANVVWLSELENLAMQSTNNGNESDIEQLMTGGYSSVELEFPEGIRVEDSGVYTCFASSESGSRTVTHSVMIELRVKLGITPKFLNSKCSNQDATIFFQLQVQHTDCLNWTQATIEKVVLETNDAVIGGIISRCEDCMTSGDTIVIAIREFQCSANPNSRGVVLFNGEITTIDQSITTSIVCGLTAWHETLPLVLIDAELLPIAKNCKLKVKFESLANPTFCEVSGLDDNSALVAFFVFLLFLILIGVGVTVAFIVIRQLGFLPTVFETLNKIVPIKVKEILNKIIPTRVMEIFDWIIYGSIEEDADGKLKRRHQRDTISTMYEDAIFPDGYNPHTQEFNPYTNVNRRSMYDTESVYLDT